MSASPPVVRPLPALGTDATPFWTGGAEGVLRLPRCPACEVLLHPSQVICPTCLGSDLVWTAVDGRAVVVGCTVNVQMWIPTFPPPYVLAIVELHTAPGVRLTTNVVGCPVEEVHVGQRVRVTFVQQDDVWLPLFEPEPGSEIPVPAVPAPDPRPRPMVSTSKYEDRVALTGIGLSDVGRRLMRTPLSLTVEACRNAVADAGLTMDDIDGLSTYPGGAVSGGIGEGGIPSVEEALRIRPTWHNGTMETPGQLGSVAAAMLAVASGLCRHVLCFRTVWEATNTELMRNGTLRPSGMGMGGRISGDMQWRIPFGGASAAPWIAMYASQYFAKYGGGRETLGEIALNGRANAARNPLAIYRDPMTMDDYLSARMISTPFGLFDCDAPCDGAVAVIVSAVETAADLRQRPVLVEAVGTKIDERQSWDQGTITHLPNVFGPAAHLWSRTDLRPADVDVAELYDGFSFNCLSWLEALGFCGVGEAADFLEGGHRIALDGKLPLNTHGGQLSAGRTHGYGFLHEAVLQLRGEAGERQVKNAQIAAVSAGGGVPAGAFLLRRG